MPEMSQPPPLSQPLYSPAPGQMHPAAMGSYMDPQQWGAPASTLSYPGPMGLPPALYAPPLATDPAWQPPYPAPPYQAMGDPVWDPRPPTLSTSPPAIQAGLPPPMQAPTLPQELQQPPPRETASQPPPSEPPSFEPTVQSQDMGDAKPPPPMSSPKLPKD
eukprot:CAMPEP_0180530192 /NCGR_PEP_ID=MMETSP1036_2-20121128/61785_1 /TAXON_ID=632150 /ORGANISM="Azadinium spinosum, Strain 3D9" /LENGTH=160 /DNA_ID=CAMNT_0022543971 /DNA_START=1 /DNA_END=480 /DNA_ORIENTATION=+